MSFLEAAMKILEEVKQPLSAEEITQKALQKGLINTKGKTPAATMGARIYVSIKTLGEKSPFIKVAKNKFALRLWQGTPRKVEFPEHSFRNAALMVLREERKPLDYKAITNIALKKGYLKTAGKTPDATMGARIYVDIKKNVSKSPFIQLGKNKFGLSEWDLNVIKSEIEKEEKSRKATMIETVRKRSIVGDPINYEGLMYGPLNESGVIFLFSKIHDKLNPPISIEAVQAAYPDAKGRRKTSKGWEDVWIEFEYKSSHFKVHKHDPKECDIIVCWEHDWKDCPLEVIELRKKINQIS